MLPENPAFNSPHTFILRGALTTTAENDIEHSEQTHYSIEPILADFVLAKSFIERPFHLL